MKGNVGHEDPSRRRSARAPQTCGAKARGCHQLDGSLAQSLQAEAWNETPKHLPALFWSDSKVAASLQAEVWQQDCATKSLQVEAWQVCSQRVRARGAGPVSLPKQDVGARPPTSHPPFEEEVLSAAGQLHWRLSDYGLASREVVGDGACQFRAVADQLYRDQELHGSVRQIATRQLRLHAAKYQHFVEGETFANYLARMAEPTTWGDNLSLQAIADAFEIEACLVTTFLERSFISIRPASGRSTQQIWLGFYAEYHYISLEPLQ